MARIKNYELRITNLLTGVILFSLLTVHWALSTASYAAELHGFLQGNYSYRTSDTHCYGAAPCDKYWLLIEERAQISPLYEDPSGTFTAKAKLDFFHDAAVDSDFDMDVREAYFTLQGGSSDAKIGRQIITWGLGDLVFINDVFPKDWTAFIIGRPIEYFKKGIDGAKFGLYGEAVNGELIIIPTFEPDTLPDSRRLLYFDPLPQVTNRDIKEPAEKPSNTEIALRLYRSIYEFDTSLYFYKGYYRTPSSPKDSTLTKVNHFYPELKVYGASTQGAAFGGVLSLEAGYYHSQDNAGSDPEIENSQVRYLAGFQKAFAGDFTASVQYYVERMMNYEEYTKTLDSSFPRTDRTRELYSIRLAQLLHYQTIRLSLFTFYSPTDKDYFVNPEIKYNITDNLWTNLGANLFGGEQSSTSLGQFRHDDNVYWNIRYEF
ncbi:MAG: hypothetical protein Q8P28_06095 [Deltaproteobacteria bacterium]|nr:hypothetical protein [Deltaproteobacteria bacterium]